MQNYRLSEDAALTIIDFDLTNGETGTLTDTGMTWLDMATYDRVMAVYVPTVGTGKVQAMTLYSGTSTAGANATAITANGSGTPTVGSTGGVVGKIVLEASADEIAASDSDGRYVGVKISLSVGTDEGRLFILRHGARYKQSGLTASVQ
jgi:hypothetical protein